MQMVSRPTLGKAARFPLQLGGRQMSIIKHYVGRRELLRELGISKNTLLRWAAERGFPQPLPNSGRVPIFDRNDIDRWLRSQNTADGKS